MKYLISHKYFEFEMDMSIPMFKGRYKGYLGNLSDAGWYWEFDDYTLLIDLIHIAKSKIKNDFVYEFEKEKIPLEVLKINTIATLKDTYTYEYLFQLLTGWRDDRLLDELYNHIEFRYYEDNDLQEKYNQILVDNYDTIKKKVMKEARLKIVNIFKESIKESNNISELLNNLEASSGLSEDIIYDTAIKILESLL